MNCTNILLSQRESLPSSYHYFDLWAFSCVLVPDCSLKTHKYCIITNWFYPGACMWAHCDTKLKYYRYNILKYVAKKNKNRSFCLQHPTSKVSKVFSGDYNQLWIVQPCIYHRGIAFPNLTVTCDNGGSCLFSCLKTV